MVRDITCPPSEVVSLPHCVTKPSPWERLSAGRLRPDRCIGGFREDSTGLGSGPQRPTMGILSHVELVLHWVTKWFFGSVGLTSRG